MGQMAGAITLLTGGYRQALDTIVAEQDGVFWFVSGKVEDRVSLQTSLPTGVKIGDVSHFIDPIADEIEPDLLNIDQKLSIRSQDRLSWISSLLADRSPFVSDLQLNIALYFALIRSFDHEKKQFIYIEDPRTATAFKDCFQANGYNCSIVNSHDNQGRGLLQALRARASAIKTYLIERKTTKCHRRLSSGDVWARLRQCDVLILDWAGKDSFNRNEPTNRSWNLERMAGLLRGHGHRVGFIAHPLSWVQNYEDISKNVTQAHDPVVLLNECRSFISVLKGCFFSWCLNRSLDSVLSLKGENITALFDLERSRDMIKPQSSLFYSYADIARNLAKRRIRPKAVVYTYENQGWERALLWGMKKHLPETRMIGYQHAPFPRRFLGVFSPRSAVELNELPHHFIVMGQEYHKWYCETGMPDNLMSVGGSLRFEKNQGVVKDWANGRKKRVLVCPTLVFEQALDMSIKAARAILKLDGIDLIINFHSVVEDQFRQDIQHHVEAVLGDAAHRVAFSTDKAVDLFDQASVLLYNTSGVVFDAVMAGMPTICVSVDGELNLDKLPSGFGRKVYSETELCDAINEIFQKDWSSPEPDKAVGDCIAPVNEEKIVKAIVYG
ncbi:MAG: hypothetical protein HWE30_07820 [Methylocystaceae bacterium]|nr:hypothetical protein [Methylocystaceae bacterium]